MLTAKTTKCIVRLCDMECILPFSPTKTVITFDSYYAQFYSDESVNNMIISPPRQLLMGQGVSITFNSNKGQKR